jgi:hypothetical protein
MKQNKTNKHTKQVKTTTAALLATALLFTSACKNDTPEEQGILSFQEKTATLTLSESSQNQALTVTLNTSQPFANDTPVGLRVASENATNGEQFNCPASVLLPAGAYSADFEITGNYAQMAEGAVYTVTLTIDPAFKTMQDGNTFAFLLSRCPPLNLADFTGRAVCEYEGMEGTYSQIVELKAHTATSLLLTGFRAAQPTDPGTPADIEVQFTTTGTLSMPATTLFDMDFGGGFIIPYHISGSATDDTAPIAGTYNSCKRTIEFIGVTRYKDSSGMLGGDMVEGSVPFIIKMD